MSNDMLFTSRGLSWFFFLGSTLVPTLEPSSPLNRKFSSISCSLFFLIPTYQQFMVKRYGCLCVASFNADDENLNLSNVMCFRGHRSIRRMHAWRRQIDLITNRIVHIGFPVYPPWIYAFGVFDHVSVRCSSIGFSFSAFVNDVWMTHLVAEHASDGQSKKKREKLRSNRSIDATLPRWSAVFLVPVHGGRADSKW